VGKGLKLSGDYLRVAQTIHVEEAADRFKGPVLILHGDQDDTVPLAYSKRFSPRYTCSDLIVLEGENHHFDQNPERMENLIREWIRHTIASAPKRM